ncbi:MAG: hypothetical protein JST19_02635 [Bacteroidetes bacterium]|nr:hypothetical protein [Bacteroidota bacterium]
MKTDKQVSPLKALKKRTKESIHKRLAKALRSITAELGQDEKNLSIDIEKESKKLAKKLVKGMIVKPEPDKEKAAVPAKTNAPAAAKPAAKKTQAPAQKAGPETKKAETAVKNGAVKHSAQKATKK